MKLLTRFLLLSLATLLPLSSLTGAVSPPNSPNIIVLFVDDLGYADLGIQGSDDVLTPNIDSIARNGIRFTDGYVTAAQCSPSRAGIITGRYQQRFGYDVNLGLQHTVQRRLGLPEEENTLGDLLQAAGYTTGMIGKWDLGTGEVHLPNERGFDYFYGFIGGSRPHPPRDDMPFFNQMRRNEEVIEETGWSSDVYAEEASAFIERNQQDPFFLFVSFTSPHWPMEAKEEDLAQFEHVEDLHRRTLLAMMAGLDRGIGEIIRTVVSENLQDRTLIFFLSDNGGATGPQRTDPNAPFHKGANYSFNDPLRGRKGMLYEGGVRIPFMAAWPGVIPPGQVSNVPVISLDIGATAVALAGAPIPQDRPLDGVTLMPLMTGEADSLPDRALYWRVKNQSAIRYGDWKFLKIGNSPAELYNLAEDIDESDNQFNQNREKARELRTKLKDWLDELEKPRW